MTIEDHEFKEVIEEYKEEILVQEEVPEPPLTDSADTAPAQGKPQLKGPNGQRGGEQPNKKFYNNT